MSNRQPPTRFLIDEFPSLHHAPFILNAMATKRGHGITFHLMLQAFSQAKNSYKEGWEQILGLAAVVQHFGGTGDPLTAETISKGMGQSTIVVTGGNQPSRGDMTNSYSLTGRPLLMPDEVMRFPMPMFLANFVGKGTGMGRLINPDLRDFPDYKLFMHGIENGYTPDVCAKSVWGMIEYREKKAREAAKPAPAPAPTKRSLLRRVLDKAIAPRPRRAKPSIDAEEWFDRIIRKVLGHESQ